MKRVLFASLFLFVLFLATPAPAVDKFLENGLKYGVGVRPLGMGGAFTAVADDINSIYYNPAGLGDLILGYSLGNQDLYGTGDTVSNYNLLNIGFLGLANMRAESTSGESLSFSTIAIGKMGGSGISWGVSYKRITAQTKVGDYDNWSGDVGLLLRLTPEMTFGLLGQDLLKGPKLETPTTARYGLAYRPFSRSLTFAFDLETGRSGDLGTQTQWGVEAILASGFKLRAGSNRGSGTLGAMLSFPPFDLNYAYTASGPVCESAIHTLAIEMSIEKERKRPFSLIQPKEFALVDVRGPLVGGVDQFSLFGGARVGADNILAEIRRATKDPFINGILLRIGGLGDDLGTMALVQEIRDELKHAKRAGKKVVAYVEESAIGDEYYLASVADGIVAPSGSSIGGLGREIEIMRISQLMKNIGIDWQILTKGKYKDTFNMFGKGLTADQKEMVSGIVSDLYRQMIQDISRDRKIDIAKLKNIGDGSIFTASAAKGMKLIDRIGYFKDASSYAAEITSQEGEVRIVAASDLFVDEGPTLFSLPSKIAVIEVGGEIVTGKSSQNIVLGGTSAGADTVTEQIRRASDDMMVRAIIVRINSPGGSAIGSGQIYQEMQRAREKGKVVVASMGDIAASGGYFIAAAADKIVADPATITGSIGVFFGMPVMAELYKKIGVSVDVVKEGKHSDMLSGLRKLSTEEQQSVLNLLEESYVEFKKAVAKGRGMTSAEVEKIAQGRVYTGSQALNLKLVDKLGGFSAAVDYAKDLAKISGEPEIIYYVQDSYLMNNLLEVSERLGFREGLAPLFGSKLSEDRLRY